MTVAEHTGPEHTGAEPTGPGHNGASGADTSAQDEGGSRHGRRPRSFVLLRKVDLDTPVHRLWAGSKLLGAAGLSLTVSLVPTWSAVGVMVALLLTTILIARIPRSAVPLHRSGFGP